MFKNWVKAGDELDRDNKTRLSNTTYCKRSIFHHLKTDEHWENIEYLGY